MSIVSLWRTGGVVLALGFLTLFVGGGARHAIGLVLKPMGESLDWDRTLLGAVIAVFMVLTAVTMMAVGRLSDRYSPVWILSGGFLVSALGIGAMAFAETAWQAFLLYGVVFAIGNGAVSITPVGVMLTRRFGSKAGVANSIAIAGMGLGQLLILSGLSVVMVEAGWRDVFLWLGVVNLVAATILLAGSRGKQSVTTVPPTTSQDGSSLGQAARTRSFWLLVAFYAICGFQDFFVSSHVVAFALDQGEGALFAGNLLAFMGLCGLIGVLGAGAWSDRSGPVAPTLACFWLRIAIFAIILVDQSSVSIAVFALGFGLTFWVTAPLTVIFTRDLFGTRNLGLISGLVTMIHHMAGGLGALLGAVFFDSAGDYTGAFWLMLIVSAAATAVTYAFVWARAR